MFSIPRRPRITRNPTPRPGDLGRHCLFSTPRTFAGCKGCYSAPPREVGPSEAVDVGQHLLDRRAQGPRESRDERAAHRLPLPPSLRGITPTVLGPDGPTVTHTPTKPTRNPPRLFRAGLCGISATSVHPASDNDGVHGTVLRPFGQSKCGTAPKIGQADGRSVGRSAMTIELIHHPRELLGSLRTDRYHKHRRFASLSNVSHPTQRTPEAG